MKFACSTLVLVLAASIGAPYAVAADPPQTPAKTLTPQQKKMKDCNAQAGDRKGDERKAFMSTCLKDTSTNAAQPAAASTKPATQQEKMKTCNADANSQGLKGDARKTFMSTCLKGSTTPAAAAH